MSPVGFVLGAARNWRKLLVAAPAPRPCVPTCLQIGHDGLCFRVRSEQPLLEDVSPVETPSSPSGQSCCYLLLPAAVGLLLVATAAALAHRLTQASLVHSAPEGSHPPFCRKSSSIAVLASDAAAHGHDSRQPRLAMLAWSGIGELLAHLLPPPCRRRDELGIFCWCLGQALPPATSPCSVCPALLCRP